MARALLSLVVVWDLLLLSRWSAGWLGESWALVTSFAVATAFVWLTRDGRDAFHRSFPPLAMPLALLSGYASLPVWLAVIHGAGVALGLDPRAAPRPAAGVVLLAISIALSPLLEELLYRERLLYAVRERLGGVAGILASSAAFALPHLEPWRMLGTFLVGLAFGAVALVSRCVAICVALHAGLNLAWATAATPLAWLLPSPLAGLVFGSLALVVSVALVRAAPAGRGIGGLAISRA